MAGLNLEDVYGDLGDDTQLASEDALASAVALATGSSGSSDQDSRPPPIGEPVQQKAKTAASPATGGIKSGAPVQPSPGLQSMGRPPPKAIGSDSATAAPSASTPRPAASTHAYDADVGAKLGDFRPGVKKRVTKEASELRGRMLEVLRLNHSAKEFGTELEELSNGRVPRTVREMCLRYVLPEHAETLVPLKLGILTLDVNSLPLETAFPSYKAPSKVCLEAQLVNLCSAIKKESLLNTVSQLGNDPVAHRMELEEELGVHLGISTSGASILQASTEIYQTVVSQFSEII